ncbi:GNAT family N-acetyltransferase [Streptomyces sp. RKAG293]|uniref:GNAT family N-acetyltransferase n=1 Tax=Streptomyces sp. RKAG293 TaxID=2893403 RepID=UPI0020335060|nr:GNAT family protein [Streptomyces sp. RKAG293]MCM2416589.1 GNAT family N-acetyltransferase [Streptomyces sp. RKAG293]
MYSLPLGADAELRPLHPWLAAEFLEHLDRARIHISPWVGASFVATDLPSAHAVLTRYAKAQAEGGGGIHGIWLDGQLVGGVMFVALDGARGVCEVGCWLEPAAEGRGLVTQAVERIIDWAVLEHGVNRVEWHTKSANSPSIRVAQRLGMAQQTTHEAEDDGWEEWAVESGAWAVRTTQLKQDVAQIDSLIADFYSAFTNKGKAQADLGRLEDLFLADGTVTGPADYSVAEKLRNFSLPRELLLAWGDLTDFYEYEVKGRTVVAGDIAQRFSRYAKEGVLRGDAFSGRGSKSFQLVRTKAGWKIAGMVWTDDLPK